METFVGIHLFISKYIPRSINDESKAYISYSCHKCIYFTHALCLKCKEHFKA